MLDIPLVTGARRIEDGEAGGGDEPLLYHVVFAFDNEAHLAAWQDSPERARWLAQVAPHTVGAQEMRRVSGLDYWFAPAGSTTKAPPRWKVAIGVARRRSWSVITAGLPRRWRIGGPGCHPMRDGKRGV